MKIIEAIIDYSAGREVSHSAQGEILISDELLTLVQKAIVAAGGDEAKIYDQTEDIIDSLANATVDIEITSCSADKDVVPLDRIGDIRSLSRQLSGENFLNGEVVAIVRLSELQDLMREADVMRAELRLMREKVCA